MNVSGEVKSVLLFDEETRVGLGWKEAGTRSGFRGEISIRTIFFNLNLRLPPLSKIHSKIKV